MKEQGESEADKLEHWREVENRIFEQRKFVSRLAATVVKEKAGGVADTNTINRYNVAEVPPSSKHFYGSSSSGSSEVPAVVASASSVPWNLIYNEQQREQYERNTNSYAVRTIHQQVIRKSVSTSVVVGFVGDSVGVCV